MVRELTPEELAWRCPEDWLQWESSADIPPATTIVGQDRAVDAIAFGLAAGGIGYNVFVTGLAERHPLCCRRCCAVNSPLPVRALPGTSRVVGPRQHNVKPLRKSSHVHHTT